MKAFNFRVTSIGSSIILLTIFTLILTSPISRAGNNLFCPICPVDEDDEASLERNAGDLGNFTDLVGFGEIPVPVPLAQQQIHQDLASLPNHLISEFDEYVNPDWNQQLLPDDLLIHLFPYLNPRDPEHAQGILSLVSSNRAMNNTLNPRAIGPFPLGQHENPIMKNTRISLHQARFIGKNRQYRNPQLRALRVAPTPVQLNQTRRGYYLIRRHTPNRIQWEVASQAAPFHHHLQSLYTMRSLPYRRIRYLMNWMVNGRLIEYVALEDFRGNAFKVPIGDYFRIEGLDEELIDSLSGQTTFDYIVDCLSPTCRDRGPDDPGPGGEPGPYGGPGPTGGVGPIAIR